MHFLHPGILWALTALAIPVIIHLFSFHRYKVLQFSNTQFIKALQSEQRTRSTIRNWLLLALRLLAIAFIVVAFARPYIPENESQSVENPRVAVYIDNSFSMDANGEYGVLLEWAKMRARELADAFPSETEYLLITNEMEPQQQRWVGKDQFVEWVQKVHTTHVVATLDDVLQRQQLVGNDTSRFVYSFLFSDLHKPTFTLKNVQPSGRERVFVVPFRNSIHNNLSIDSLWFSSPGLYVGKIEDVMVRLRNHSNDDISNQSLQIYVNDSMKNTVPFSIGANSTVDVKGTFLQGKSGWNIGRVEIQDYPITFDNQLFFSYNIAPQTKVLCISDKKTVDYFSILFKSDKSIGYKRVSSLNVRQDDLFESQLVIIDAPSQLSTGMVDALARFVDNGGHIALMPSEEQNINQLLKSTGGPAFGELQAQEGTAVNLNMKHRLFDDAFAEKNKDYSMPTYKCYFKVEANSRQRIERLFDAESGDYLCFGYNYGRGKVYVSAMPFSPECTNLMMHPVFVPMFYNMALQSVASGRLYFTLKPNVQLAVNVPDVTKRLSLVQADVITYPASRLSGNGVMLYPNVSELIAENCAVMADNEPVGVVSFNFDRAESVQQYMELDDALQMLVQQGFDVRVVKPTDSSFVADVAKDSANEGLWRLFAVLSFVALLAELFLLKKK